MRQYKGNFLLIVLVLIGIATGVIFINCSFWLQDEMSSAEQLLLHAQNTQITTHKIRELTQKANAAGPLKDDTSDEAQVTFDYSEGNCADDSQCVWAGEGCGGGHGMCTNEPQKYRGMVTTCVVNPDFPSNNGYACGCIVSAGKCGWRK